MSKRIFALLLCVVMLIPCLASCSSGDPNDIGPYITMYLTDEIYDFDPAQATYNNGASNVIGLLFDTLFKLDENGKVVKSLAKDYKIVEGNNEYTMEITLNETKWSNGQAITAENVLYAWRRLLNQENSYAAASLLFDIKNARAIKNGDEAPDDLGVEIKGTDTIIITFEGKIDYDQFLMNLTSVATAPLLESAVEKTADWAKKSSTIVTSGPFKLGKITYTIDGDEKVKDDNALQDDGTIDDAKSYPMKLSYFYLERNRHYYRDDKKDILTSSVNPYRILVDCTKTDEELLDAYKADDQELFFMADIPLSLRTNDYIKNNENLTVSDALSTTVCYLNQKIAPFNNAAVRQALSLAVDRKAIADAVVYAEAATGLVPNAVFNTEAGKGKETFRSAAGNALLNTEKDLNAAKTLLSNAKINAADYSFSIKVASYDDVNCAIAEMLAANWRELGFNVTVEKVQPLQNNDYLASQESVPTDICDDIFIEAIERGKYEVILCDSGAFCADASSMLSAYAKPFSGMALEDGTYAQASHHTGYDSASYNKLMEAVYFIPYFSSLTENDYTAFGDELYTAESFNQLYKDISAIYQENGIKPTDKESEWAAQKAKLLHKAEELLMKDLPVIPIVFNKNAVLTSDKLSDVSSSYDTPYNFTKAQLADHGTYVISYKTLDAQGNETTESVSIFEDFPEVAWEAWKAEKAGN